MEDEAVPGRKRRASSSEGYYDWTQGSGGIPVNRFLQIDNLVLNQKMLTLDGEQGKNMGQIGEGGFGTVDNIQFGDDEFGFDVTHVAKKVIEMSGRSSESKLSIIKGMMAAERLNDCNLVKFKAWITNLNEPKIGKRVASDQGYIERGNAEDIVRSLTDESQVIIAMEPMNGNGIDFLSKEDRYRSEFWDDENMGTDPIFVKSLQFFLDFLSSLKLCLDDNEATFADMKLQNLGYIDKTPPVSEIDETSPESIDVEWRLLDLDGINGNNLTYCYKTPGTGIPDLNLQTTYAMGVTVANYLSPKFFDNEVWLSTDFSVRSFDAVSCSFILFEFLSKIDEMKQLAQREGITQENLPWEKARNFVWESISILVAENHLLEE
tara:strand:+ start:178 stop:1311 length:1134 start_codon:yes stop_codon:yes gene_type:complete